MENNAMNFDFPTFLVLACLVTGGIWLADAVLFAPRRKRLALEAAAGGAQIGSTDITHNAIINIRGIFSFIVPPRVQYNKVEQ